MNKIFFWMILTSSTMFAKSNSDLKFPPLSWDQKLANQIASTARENNLPNATYPNGKLVGKETANQKKKPLIPEKFAKQVVDHAVFWNTAQWCGLSMDQADFSVLQDKKKWNSKQLVFIAVLHGSATNLVREQLNSSGTCSNEFKIHIENSYPTLFTKKTL